MLCFLVLIKFRFEISFDPAVVCLVIMQTINHVSWNFFERADDRDVI